MRQGFLPFSQHRVFFLLKLLYLLLMLQFMFHTFANLARLALFTSLLNQLSKLFVFSYFGFFSVFELGCLLLPVVAAHPETAIRRHYSRVPNATSQLLNELLLVLYVLRLLRNHETLGHFYWFRGGHRYLLVCS